MFTINAEVRKEQGKGASRRLRAANKFPAIIYGGKGVHAASGIQNTKPINCRQTSGAAIGRANSAACL